MESFSRELLASLERDTSIPDHLLELRAWCEASRELRGVFATPLPGAKLVLGPVTWDNDFESACLCKFTDTSDSRAVGATYGLDWHNILIRLKHDNKDFFFFRY